MKQLLFLCLFALATGSCNNGGAAEKTSDFAGFTLEKIPGSSAFWAVKTEGGKVIEEGMVLHGKKNGQWVTYHGDVRNFPKTIANYADDVLTGPQMEINPYGQFLAVSEYRNGQLNGRMARYNYTRLVEEMYYKNGVLDGPYTLYFDDSDIKQRTSNFKNGLEDGTVRFFNEQGKITMEYEYKEGKKISGGMVEQRQ